MPGNPVVVRFLFALARYKMRTLFRLASIVIGVELPFRDLGDLRLPHPTGVVVHSDTKIGRGVTIYQNATVASHPRVNRAATIEDGVVIGAGAAIIGPVTLGAGSFIAANAVVTQDVPPGSTVAGVPARVISSSRFQG